MQIKLKPVRGHMEASSQSWMEQAHRQWTVYSPDWQKKKEEEEEEEKEEEEVVVIIVIWAASKPFLYEVKVTKTAF